MAQAQIKEGEYLIGVEEFKYENIAGLTDRLYERLYDKEVLEKRANFAVYNVLKDELRVVPVELKKKWGGDGILGCELSQGHLFRFPQNLEKYRQERQAEEKKREELIAARKELSNSDGAGKILAESLKRRSHNLPKRTFLVRNPERVAELKEQLENGSVRKFKAEDHPSSLEQRVQRLERTVEALQRAVLDPELPS